MARRNTFGLLVIPVVALLIFSFQNCGSGFQVAQLDSLKSLSELGTSDLQVELKDSSGTSLSMARDIYVDAEYSLVISGVRIPTDAVVTWTATPTTGGAVHVHSGSVPGQGELHCEAPGIISLSVSVVSAGKTYSSRNISLSCVAAPGATPEPTPAPGATTVTFRIPAGTGNGAWNTLATAVVVNVGQTLRIINDDSIAHRLHTGGAPCGHQPSNSAPGASFDCVVSRPINAANGGTYDHNIGTAARFYVTAIDGPALYSTNCQSCHSALASSAVRNTTAAEIRAQINTQSAMRNINLTDAQLNAIAYSLSH